MPRKGDKLQLPDNAYHVDHLETKLQRLGVVILILILIAGIFGLFGEGLFGSSKESDAEKKLILTYNKFMRRENDDFLQLEVALDKFSKLSTPSSRAPQLVRGDTGGSSLQVWTTRKIIENFYVKQIVPQPLYTELNGDRIIYHFSVKQPNEKAMITFLVDPTSFGKVEGEFGVVNGASIKFNQFILP